MGATEKIAQFVAETTYKDIPHQAVELAKRTALDTLAAALAGSAEPGSRAITRYVNNLGGPPQAAVIGGGFKAAVADAALANGCIAHALDYDDCGMKIGHPSVMVLPALLSLGDQLQASGQDVLTAYILGLEVEGKVALNADFKLMERSLNNQSWYGTLGAAAACARLLRLDTNQTRHALGLAANFACGVSASHGTMIAPMSAGNACRNGVVAALMARENITANPDIIETKSGFLYALVGPDNYNPDHLADGLGNPFYIVSPGIGIKKYPSCYHTHRALDAMFQLMAEHNLGDKDIAEVNVGTSERALRVLAYSEPGTPYQAKFSMPYCIAAAMVDRKVSLATFTPEKLSDERIVEARKKVRLSFPNMPIWPGLADVEPDTVFVGNPVNVRTVDGRSYNARVDILHGDPEKPLSDSDLLAKYRDCGQSLLDPADIQRSSELVLGLDKVEDIREVMDILAASTGRPHAILGVRPRNRAQEIAPA
ncbi:MAG: MmgE/PrpD family protein [Deltaproteobacteria bacterium]|nr:MmgE/PrpD family protein [Deltaproteobacteria bacterium]